MSYIGFQELAEEQEGRPGGGEAIFQWGDGTLITLTDMNKILEVLLGQEHPKIMTRAFRPALPSILAREGTSEEMLKALGWWTIQTYLHYVQAGRNGDWKGWLAAEASQDGYIMSYLQELQSQSSPAKRVKKRWWRTSKHFCQD